MAFFVVVAAVVHCSILFSSVRYDTENEKKRNIMDNGNSLFAIVHL